MTVPYLDLDLLVEPAGDKYRARVLNSPAGQARIEFVLAVTESELSNLYADGAIDQNLARKLGGELFNALFAGELGGILRNSLDQASQAQQGLRIRLRLNDAPQLASLPWEFLYDASLDRFLAHSNGSPIVRFFELPQRIEPFSLKPPLRMLVIFSGPSDYPPLDLEVESSRLGKALQELEHRGLLVREQLADATLTSLQAKLRTSDYHILHYVGHGGFLSETQEGALVFKDDNGNGRLVSGRDLGTLLRDSKSLRLVVLNACESARSSRQNPFTGVAPELVQQNIPAVIAMQFPITDRAAIAFATGFYGSMADGLPVDAAVSEARKTILAEVNNAEWATPVLFMRLSDGRIFDLAQLTDTERKHLAATGLDNAAQAAYANEDWAKAIEYWQESQSLELSAAVSNKIQQATREQKLAELYEEGERFFKAGKWEDAINRLTALKQMALGYKDSESLLETARKNLPQVQVASGAISSQEHPGSPALDSHYQSLSKAILDGRLVAFLGAGANLAGRPSNSNWQKGNFLPSSSELAEYLSGNFSYEEGDKDDLTRVSQYIELTNGAGPLYDEIHRLLDVDYQFTPLHEFFATLPGLLRSKGLPLHNMLIVTTNFDDAMERAFQAANEPYDLVTYVATGEQAGKFQHRPAGGDPVIIDKPNEYRGVSLDQRPVVLKLHGAVNRGNPDLDSYVITEDDYIEYLARTDISNLIPVTLAAKLRRSNFLFLGYSLHDWNLRVILHRLWGDQKLSYKSWSVLVSPESLDVEFWRKRDVELIQVTLEDYIRELGIRMQNLTPAKAKP